MPRLIPLEPSSPTITLTNGQWTVACICAGMSGRQGSYSKQECVKIASALRTNPKLLEGSEAPVSEVIMFLETCGGLSVF